MGLLQSYQDIYKMLFRIAYSKTYNIEDTKDILQDTFLKAFLHYDPDMTEEHTRKWLVCITYNTLNSFIRQNRMTEPIDDHINELPSTEWSIELLMYFADIKNMSTSVPEELLKYYISNIKDDVSLLEISRATGISYERLRYWKRIFVNDFISWIHEKE